MVLKKDLAQRPLKQKRVHTVKEKAPSSTAGLSVFLETQRTPDSFSRFISGLVESITFILSYFSFSEFVSMLFY